MGRFYVKWREETDLVVFPTEGVQGFVLTSDEESDDLFDIGHFGTYWTWGDNPDEWDDVEINNENYEEWISEGALRTPFLMNLVGPGPWQIAGLELEQVQLKEEIEQNQARLVEIDEELQKQK